MKQLQPIALFVFFFLLSYSAHATNTNTHEDDSLKQNVGGRTFYVRKIKDNSVKIVFQEGDKIKLRVSTPENSRGMVVKGVITKIKKDEIFIDSIPVIVNQVISLLSLTTKNLVAGPLLALAGAGIAVWGGYIADGADSAPGLTFMNSSISGGQIAGGLIAIAGVTITTFSFIKLIFNSFNRDKFSFHTYVEQGD